MKVLVDLDLILYSCLFATKDQNYYAQVRACDNKLSNLLELLDCDSHEIVTTGQGNFRYKVDPNYKSNRKDTPRPEYLYDARQYFIKYWDAIAPDGIEPDDYIATHCGEDDIIATLDKDMNQLDRKIYNWNKNTLEWGEGMTYFWKQMLTGDAIDGIEGLPNPAKSHHKNPPNFTLATATKELEGLTLEECKHHVQHLYQQTYTDGWFEQFDNRARCLFLQRKPGDDYNFHI